VSDSGEDWKPGEHSLRHQIRITDERTVQVYRQATWPETGPQFVPYVVRFVFVSTTWQVGADEGTQRVRLDAYNPSPASRRMQAAVERGYPVSISIRPEQLQEIPDWLEDIVLRASPRDIDTPDMKPYAPFVLPNLEEK
jgi:hypothetical protein